MKKEAMKIQVEVELFQKYRTLLPNFKFVSKFLRWIFRNLEQCEPIIHLFISCQLWNLFGFYPLLQLTVYNSNGGPCYRCLFPQPPPPESVTNCSEGGVIGVGKITSGLMI